MIEQFHQPSNAAMHQKSLVQSILHLTPLLTRVVEQGIREHVMATDFPQEAVEFLLAFAQTMFDKGLFHWEPSEAGSSIENSFVTQNDSFDFLPDTESNVIQINDGEIAVPIWHMKEYGLQLGDTVRIAANNFRMEFLIAAFVRDVQMNPSIVTSKRFVVSTNDWNIYETISENRNT